jgi:hypothetical protein
MTAKWYTLAALTAGMFAAAACNGDVGGDGALDDLIDSAAEADKDKEGTDDGTIVEETVLDHRVIDYSEAFKTLHVKLLDVSPPLEAIKRLAAASDQQREYEEMVDEAFDDPRFNRRIIRWWRDTLRQGGGAFDTAPNFAARVVAEGLPYQELFTASENTCPTYDGDSETFVDGTCDNNVPTHAGLLTNPGSMSQFYGNMAFRRVRWIQEIFACKKFPAEYSDTPIQKGEGQYTAPWPFDALATAPIDFQDTSSVICANCHATMNRIAPLFANFDMDGMWQDGISVETPTAPDPTTTELSHWLQAGEQTAWRWGEPVADLPELGAAMAEDPAVKACITARMWNFAMSKEDIVAGLATVPAEVIDTYMTELSDNGGDLKEALKMMFKSEDFVSF